MQHPPGDQSRHRSDKLPPRPWPLIEPCMPQSAVRHLYTAQRTGVGPPRGRVLPVELAIDDSLRADAIRISTVVDSAIPYTTAKSTGEIDEILAMFPRKLPNRIHDLSPVPVCMACPEMLPREAAGTAHLEESHRSTPQTIWAYSDGSKGPQGQTGAGWSIHLGRTQVAMGYASCRTRREVPDAEALGAK